MDDTNEIKYSGCNGDDYVCYKQVAYILYMRAQYLNK